MTIEKLQARMAAYIKAAESVEGGAVDPVFTFGISRESDKFGGAYTATFQRDEAIALVGVLIEQYSLDPEGMRRLIAAHEKGAVIEKAKEEEKPNGYTPPEMRIVK